MHDQSKVTKSLVGALVHEVIKVGMKEGLLRGDALAGLVLEHGGEEVDAEGLEPRDDLVEGPGGPLREGGLVVRELGDARPDLLGGGAEGPEDPEELVDLAVTGEERVLVVHLGKDAADRPDVHGHGVVPGAEEDLGGPVPKSDHLVGVGADGDAKGPGEAKVGELEDAVPVDQHVLGLHVPVQHAVAVAVRDALEHLEKIRFHELGGHALGLGRVHVPLQVLVQILEAKVEPNL
jgi:hypothetical protein